MMQKNMEIIVKPTYQVLFNHIIETINTSCFNAFKAGNTKDSFPFGEAKRGLLTSLTPKT
jgi:hypothetical protein